MPILLSPDERLIASSNVRLYFITFGTLIITPEVGISLLHKDRTVLAIFFYLRT